MSGTAANSTSGEHLRVEKAIYGGDGLARTAEGEVVLLPFVLPGELVALPASAGERTSSSLRVLEPSPERVAPGCVHFGTCGGCQYQMARYGEQLRIKEAILRETLERAGIGAVPALQTWASPEPWGYRNRIRLRVREIDGDLRLGYSVRGRREFLPVQMCPIAAPLLWATAEALLQAAKANRDAAEWLRAAAEIELLCDDQAAKVQVHLLCAGAFPERKGSLERMAAALVVAGAPVLSLRASRLHVASGRALEPLAHHGAEGLAYRVGEHSFWLRPGTFFQVNRFLIARMVEIVCAGRSGALAWDLFAGVGLFARKLAERFAAVTAVEASPAALAELKRGLRRANDQAVDETTLAFLRRAVVQRDRPELIVLDPPRAGAGEEACGLLGQLAPPEVVYVSCDPTTLARDAVVLLAAGYEIAELHLVDLFPHTFHLETVMVLRRAGVGS